MRDHNRREKGEDIAEAVRKTLAIQQSAWNAHDIESFLAHYVRDERVTFVGASGVARGFAGLRERYAKAYPDPAAMGSLSLELNSIEPISSTTAIVVGSFKLTATSGSSSGIFSLVMVEVDGSMKIIMDHTTATPTGI